MCIGYATVWADIRRTPSLPRYRISQTATPTTEYVGTVCSNSQNCKVAFQHAVELLPLRGESYVAL